MGFWCYTSVEGVGDVCYGRAEAAAMVAQAGCMVTLNSDDIGAAGELNLWTKTGIRGLHLALPYPYTMAFLPPPPSRMFLPYTAVCGWLWNMAYHR